MIEQSVAGGWSPRRIVLDSVPNLRDVGGAPAGHGRVVRPDTLFRSTQLANVNDDDRSVLETLRLSMVVDLRTAVEVEQAPDVRVTDTYVWLDVLRDYAMASAVGVEDIFSDPATFEQVLRDGTATAMMREAYVAMVDLPSARASYSRWLRDLAQGDGAVLVHCTNGKDRTGWAVALALLAVGVGLDDVFTDYLTTNDQLLPALAEMFEGVQAQGVDPELLMPIMGVREEYLQTALETVDALGGLDSYLDGLGLTDGARDLLRDRLTHQSTA
jgi:protein-tyrosine phosphatase